MARFTGLPTMTGIWRLRGAFLASTGLTARALQQTTGLSVDNTEALGALSDASVSEADLLAGRFDGAEVRAWLVNWASVEDRVLQFRGTFGEVSRAGGRVSGGTARVDRSVEPAAGACLSARLFGGFGRWEMPV